MQALHLVSTGGDESEVLTHARRPRSKLFLEAEEGIVLNILRRNEDAIDGLFLVGSGFAARDVLMRPVPQPSGKAEPPAGERWL